jgi:hypothetical protein
MKNEHFVAFFSTGSRKSKFHFFILHSLCAHGSYKGLMSNVNSLFWTSSIGLSKTHSIIFYECLVEEKSMTKNGDFGQNRQNRSTSNAYRIAGPHNAFRFFSLKTYIYYSWTKKTSYGRCPIAAILPKNSQVTIAKWSQSLLSPDVCRLRNHDIFFISKSYRKFCCDHFEPFPD